LEIKKFGKACKMNILIVSETTKKNYEVVKDRLQGHNVSFADTTNYIEKIKNVEFVIAGKEQYTSDILNSSKLKVISRCGHGTDNIDGTAAEKKDIVVLDARGSLDDTVADITIGYIIAAMRKIKEIDKKVRRNGWGQIEGNDLTEKTVGIIGLGGIGTAVAKRLQPFRTNTIFYDIDKEKQKDYSYAKFVSSKYLFQNSDIITLHCDLNTLSWNIINKRTLAAMKKGAVIVNTARGAIMDLDALIDSIAIRKISYAVLDVYPDEPLAQNHKIREIKNVLLGSHSACSSIEGQRKLVMRAVDNLLEEIK
jgi:D-3-phosphoglycerate dehydrogenase